MKKSKLVGILLAFILNAEAQETDKVYTYENISFHVKCANNSSINKLKVTTKGLVYDDTLTQEIDGTVTNIEVTDLDNNGSPEIYIFINSAGSGSYGSLVAYSVNNKKSLSNIYIKEVSSYKQLSVGYMGHDTFSIKEENLVQEFPIYKKRDFNNNPTGGVRKLHYKLVQGKASWILKLTSLEEN